jgi:hypothetical protein
MTIQTDSEWLRRLNERSSTITLREAIELLDSARGLNVVPLTNRAHLATHYGRVAYAQTLAGVQEGVRLGRKVVAVKAYKDAATAVRGVPCTLREALDTINDFWVG